jgi:hypothetical protein
MQSQPPGQLSRTEAAVHIACNLSENAAAAESQEAAVASSVSTLAVASASKLCVLV